MIQILIFSILSWAQFQPERIVYEYGYGREAAYCDSSFCIDSLKRYAERSGSTDAKWRCESLRGRAIGSAQCQTRCSPGYIPPGSRSWTVCEANCQVRCEVD